MASSKKPNKPSKYSKSFDREIQRLERIVKQAERRGFTFEISPIPQKPQNITRADVQALKQITPAKITKLGIEGKKVELPPKKSHKTAKTLNAGTVRKVGQNNEFKLAEIEKKIDDIKKEQARMRAAREKVKEMMDRLEKKKQELLNEQKLDEGRKAVLLKESGKATGDLMKAFDMANTEEVQNVFDLLFFEEDKALKILRDVLPKIVEGLSPEEIKPEDYDLNLGFVDTIKDDMLNAGLSKEYAELKQIADRAEKLFDEFNDKVAFTDEMNYLTDQVGDLLNRIEENEQAYKARQTELQSIDADLKAKAEEYLATKGEKGIADIEIINERIAEFRKLIQLIDSDMVPFILREIQNVINTVPIEEIARRLRKHQFNQGIVFYATYAYNNDEYSVEGLVASIFAQFYDGRQNIPPRIFEEYRRIYERESKTAAQRMSKYNKERMEIRKLKNTK